MTHILTPFDLPQNQEIAAAIQRGTDERLAREVPVDRRQPEQVRQELLGMQERLAGYKQALNTHEREEVEVLGKISRLKKDRKTHEKAALKNPRSAGLLQQVIAKLGENERELRDVQNDTEVEKRRISEQAARIENFLKCSPQGFISNAELLEDYKAAEETEEAIRKALRR